MREFVAFFNFLVWQSRWSYLSKVHAEHVERNGGVNVAVSGGVSLQGHLQDILLLGFSLFLFWGRSSVGELNQSSLMNFFAPFVFSWLKAKSLLEILCLGLKNLRVRNFDLEIQDSWVWGFVWFFFFFFLPFCKLSSLSLLKW